MLPADRHWQGRLSIIAACIRFPRRRYLDFLAERLRVQLRAEGERHDVLAAVFAAGADDVIPRLLARTEAVTALLDSADGANLLTAYRRAANILRIEDRKDGPHDGEPERGAASAQTRNAHCCAPLRTRMTASPRA